MQHGSAFFIPINHVEHIGGVEFAIGALSFEYLGIFVVDHGLSSIDFLLQQCLHIKLLLHIRDIFRRIDSGFGHTGEEFEFIAEAPVANLLAFEIGGRGDVGVFPRNLQSTRTFKDLCDSSDACTLFARSQRLWHPRDGVINGAGGQLGLRNDVHATFDNRYVKTLSLVEALVNGGEVASELRLGYPLQLQLHRSWCGAVGRGSGGSGSLSRNSGCGLGGDSSGCLGRGLGGGSSLSDHRFCFSCGSGGVCSVVFGTSDGYQGENPYGCGTGDQFAVFHVLLVGVVVTECYLGKFFNLRRYSLRGASRHRTREQFVKPRFLCGFGEFSVWLPELANGFVGSWISESFSLKYNIFPRR